MSNPYVGEIKMFAGNFAPRAYAFCDGQLLAVSQNDALFSLFGTIYGGDGRNSFGLPDLRGRIPLHQGQGPGLSSRRLGSKAGNEDVTLTTNQMPSHNHAYHAADAPSADAATPGGHFLQGSPSVNVFAEGSSAIETFASGTISNEGGSRSHSNLQPTLCINFIVALFGVYPSRS